jgi:D-serine deaminase-like pyridoxal phosphate-dependent protein
MAEAAGVDQRSGLRTGGVSCHKESMSEPRLTPEEENAINERIAKQIEERRRQRPDRRRRTGSAPTAERRRTCAYCFQAGDHPTAKHCLRALERSA